LQHFPIEGRATFLGIRRHTRVYMGRGQNMPDIVARPDFPAIRELSVEDSEVVKKVTHAGIELIVAVGRLFSDRSK
jgi:hypothetical protein